MGIGPSRHSRKNVTGDLIRATHANTKEFSREDIYRDHESAKHEGETANDGRNGAVPAKRLCK